MKEYLIPKEFNQSDRIGNFTMPQVVILGGTTVLCLFMMSIMPVLLAAIISVPVLILMVFAMYKTVNGIPIYEFALVYAVYRAMPKRLVYRTNNLKDEFALLEEIDIFEEEGVKK
jgi:uncharacterized membrane protein